MSLLIINMNILENVKHSVADFCIGMGIFAVNKEGEVTVSFKNEINLNDFFKPDQIADATAEKSTSLKRRKVGNLKLQTAFSFRYLFSKQKPEQMFSPKSYDQLELAAIKVQKVYKSYRIRRILADCAVVCEELWFAQYPTLLYSSHFELIFAFNATKYHFLQKLCSFSLF